MQKDEGTLACAYIGFLLTGSGLDNLAFNVSALLCVLLPGWILLKQRSGNQNSRVKICETVQTFNNSNPPIIKVA